MYIDRYITVLEDALNKLLEGDPSPVENRELFNVINMLSMEIVSIDGELSDKYIHALDVLIHICNIVYNNFPIDDDSLILDNGVYDLLLEKLKVYNPNFQVGAEPIVFNYEAAPQFRKKGSVQLLSRIDIDYDKMLFYEELLPGRQCNYNNYPTQLITRTGQETGIKLRNTSHEHPDLVGTLDKCKFVLDKDAEKAEVLNDPKVKVLERDFFAPQLMSGIIDTNRTLTMIGELKYDGVSMVVHIQNRIVVRAISRGDTGMDAAVDYTPIFYGYPFPNVPPEMELEIKCEAVMLYKNLLSYCEARGYDYKNARSAIIGLTGLNDGYLYRDFVTLVPLKVVCTNDISDNRFDVNTFNNVISDRLAEINFINDFLISEMDLRYVILEGNYQSLLFQIKKFVEEAEMMRSNIEVMYDGVVLSYVDPTLIEKLGRENFINKWQIAIKFRTLKKRTKLLGITYTVGQNGQITPMAHYQPVEFIGTTHTKSSIASVKRFNENKFKIGNIIEVEYINDVIPYVSTPKDLPENINNPNPVLEFIHHCPACRGELTFSDKAAYCTNPSCEGRTVARMANMMDKLGVKGFAERYMEQLNVTSLNELYSMSVNDIAIKIHSEVLAKQLFDSLIELKNKPNYDYFLIGALGFTGIAQDSWSKIFRNITVRELYDLMEAKDYNAVYFALTSIKGIGQAMANTILNEFDMYKDVIYTFITEWNMIDSKGIQERLKIRFTGIRDPELEAKLEEMGYDANSKGGVTKDTYILLIPSEGFKSTKMNKIGPNTKVIPIEEFKNNMNKFL